MKAMIVKAYGENAAFESEEVATPTAETGQLLIKISASSVNTVDTMIRRMGEELPLSPKAPAILGMDFAGVVEAVGDGVEGFVAGDEVYGCAGGLGELPGTLADYIAADHRLVAHKPKNLSMREAAALPLVAITAFEGLTRAGIESEQKVLVHGGSGGVGHVALQLAKHFGADVYATGGGEPQMKLIESLGATAINYKTESVEQYVAKHTGGAGFDVVFMLLPMLTGQRREEHARILRSVALIAEAGELKPVLDDTQFSLDEIGQAHARLESGQAMGKVVVEN